MERTAVNVTADAAGATLPSSVSTKSCT